MSEQPDSPLVPLWRELGIPEDDAAEPDDADTGHEAGVDLDQEPGQ